jgi:hypothetical protein
MQRLQAFKFELMPTGEQQRQMRRFAGSCRFVFNKALALQKALYERGEKKLGYAGLCKELTQWRNSPDTAWLADAPVHPLQQTLKDLECAYSHFFAKRADFPRFKKKGQHDSFRYPDPKQIKLDQANGSLFLPKLGWLRYRRSRDVLGTVKNITVSLACGKWFVSIQTKNLSVNYVDVERDLPERDDRGGEMVERDEAAFQLFVAHQQLAEPVEPAMTDLDHPPSRLLFRVAPFDVGLGSPADDVRDVAVALDGAKMLGASVAGIGAQMLVSPMWRVLPLDNDGAEHVIESLAVMNVGPAHDERQGDATAVHQQVALAPIFSPDPSGSARPIPVPVAPSSLRRPRSAIAMRCLACRRTPPSRPSTALRRNLPSPTPGIACARRWRSRISPWAVPSTGTQCAARTRWPRTPAGPALAVDPRQAGADTPCPLTRHAAVPAVPPVPRMRPSRPRTRLAWPMHHSNAAHAAAQSVILTIYG